MITIHNLNEMDKFAQILVKHLSAKDLILLNGDLGAGKTTLTQFIGKALGVKRTINSPTFNIIKSYTCLLYTSPSPRDRTRSRMPSSA